MNKNKFKTLNEAKEALVKEEARLAKIEELISFIHEAFCKIEDAESVLPDIDNLINEDYLYRVVVSRTHQLTDAITFLKEQDVKLSKEKIETISDQIKEFESFK